MKVASEVSERIKKLRERYQREVPRISLERAKFFTEKWRQTEDTDVPQSIRVAVAMKNVFENMTHYIDDDDRTEHCA